MMAPWFHFSEVNQTLVPYGTTPKLLAACLFGGAVGLERESRHKASGLRTNLLMCVACAFFTVISVNLASSGGVNKGQVAANIVQGVGFLGAGLIMRTKSRVLGLTSAATVFVVASIGMACGAGLYMEATVATVIVVLSLRLIGWMEWELPWKQFVLLYEVRGESQKLMYGAILNVLDQAHIRMNVVEKDSFGTLERVTFAVTTNRARHNALLLDLRASDKTDEVMAFPDTDQE